MYNINSTKLQINISTINCKTSQKNEEKKLGRREKYTWVNHKKRKIICGWIAYSIRVEKLKYNDNAPKWWQSKSWKQLLFYFKNLSCFFCQCIYNLNMLILINTIENSIQCTRIFERNLIFNTSPFYFWLESCFFIGSYTERFPPSNHDIPCFAINEFKKCSHTCLLISIICVV